MRSQDLQKTPTLRSPNAAICSFPIRLSIYCGLLSTYSSGANSFATHAYPVHAIRIEISEGEKSRVLVVTLYDSCSCILAAGMAMASFFNFRMHSLLRSNILTLGSLAISFPLAGFPLNQTNPVMIFPILGAAVGMAEAFRCIQMRWSLYHGTVILSLYMDVFVLTMILFLALYPLIVQ